MTAQVEVIEARQLKRPAEEDTIGTIMKHRGYVALRNHTRARNPGFLAEKDLFWRMVLISVQFPRRLRDLFKDV